MTTQGDTKLRRRLRKLVALLLLIAVAAAGVMLVRACGPNPALLEQRATERAAWEKTQTAEQRASADAWRSTVSEMQRQSLLMASVFLSGNIIIAAAIFRSVRVGATEMAARRRRLREALFRVWRRGTAALGVACAIAIAVPLGEMIVFGGLGMYSGEQSLAAALTVASFLFVWIVSLGLASVLLWRRSRASA